jgi:hypothetical protein
VNGHNVGQHAGWLLAALALAVGATTGLTDRQGTLPLSPRSVGVDYAASDTSVAVDEAASLEGALGSAPDSALDADSFDWPAATPAQLATPKPVKVVHKPAPAPAPAAPAPLWWTRYHGTNHVWMPTLGINRTVYLFPCSRSTAPANYVYRWGCAGHNNVYLLGHAYGVFKALHDAYYNGKLRLGMPVIYADSRGRTHLFRVKTWRVVDPGNAAWAIASQPVPSMTLQTCIGRYSQLRLNVRLVEVRA